MITFQLFRQANGTHFYQKSNKNTLQYRLTYLAETEVNGVRLGTVLANDEIVNGVSERGGFPVFARK